MTTDVLAALVDRVVARVIQEGKRRCSGHVLVLDAYTIRCLLTEELASLVKELALIREAAHDPSLSNASVRAIASGLREPTKEDLEWAYEEML